MGSIFNTPGTQQIINVLSTTFTTNFAKTATDANLIADLDPSSSNLSSNDFATKYSLTASGGGSASINAHWKIWLDYFDDNGGDLVRSAMAAALRNTARYEAIEFFTSQDTIFAPSVVHHKNKNSGKHSLIVSVKTPTYDQLP
jgi:hypothetical protein